MKVNEHKRLKENGELLDIGDDGGEMLHYDNPDFQVFCRRNEIGANEDFPNMTIHWHDDLEFIHVLSGRISYRLNGQIVSMEAGEGIFVNSRQIHVIKSEDSPCVLDCIIFHPMILCSSRFIEEKYVYPVISNKATPYILLSNKVRWQGQLLELLSKTTDLSFSQDNELLMMDTLFRAWKLIYENIKIEPKDKLVNDSGLATVKRMVDFINTNYHDKLTLSSICKAGGVGRTTCNDLFVKYVNSTPMDYLRAYRISKSVELLDNTDMNVSEIAYEVGFSGSSYYTECFKDRMECTPLEYRKIKKEWEANHKDI